MTKEEAVAYMQKKNNIGFIVRPISLHGYGILEAVKGQNSANLIICDLTFAEARHLTDVAKGFCV